MAKKSKENDRDSLIDSVAESLNKQYKDLGESVYFLDKQDDPSSITDWVSTGSSLLDLAISNRPNAGLPVGRVVEVTGLEGAGKSLLSAHILANTQKQGGVAVFIDTESAGAPEFWKSLGVDLTKMMYVPADTVEEIFDKLESLITLVRKSNKSRILTVVVDSVTNASTKAEQETTHGKDGYATGKAIIVTKAMRKITNMIAKQKILLIFTNQLKTNLKAMAFGDPYTTSGGKAIAYASSVRIRLSKKGLLKKGELPIGYTCGAHIKKNRVGPPERKADFGVYYDSGIADYSSWVDVLKELGILKKDGDEFAYLREDGEKDSLKISEFVKLMTQNEPLKQYFYKKICDNNIMIYRDPNSKVEDNVTSVEETDEVQPEVENVE